MNAVVFLYLVAAMLNCVSGTFEFSTTSNDLLLNIATHQITDIIRIREDARKADAAHQTGEAIHYEYQHVDLCGPILCVSANLTEGTLTGLAGYEVLKMDFSSDGVRFTFDIDMIIPKLELYSEYYEMKGTIMDALPLAGEGKLYFEITDFRVWTTIVLQVSDHTSIESFYKSGFNIKSILSLTEFDSNIDSIFNTMIEELLASHLNRFNRAIAAQVGDILKDILNPMLN